MKIEALKPVVDKNVKKIIQKQDKALSSLQKSFDKKTSALEIRREKYMRKLQLIEQRKDAVQKRINARKRKKNASKSSSGSFVVQKYEKEVENTKKEIKAILEELDRLKKEEEKRITLKNTEFQNLINQEESQITQINTTFNTKTSQKREQIEEILIQAATISSNLENIKNGLRKSGETLRSQVEVDLKLGTSEGPVLAKLPIYLIKYMKARDQRYILLSPIELSEEIGILNGLKRVLSLNSDSKLKTLMHPANKVLQEKLITTIMEKMQIDQTFQTKVDELCYSSNLIDLASFAQTLKEGLDEIEQKGLLSREEASTMCRSILEDST